MSQLERITTEYVEAEDRIRLSGEGLPGETLVLWLSQRLLKRLLPHLLAWLEQQSGAGEAPQVPAYHIDAVQGFAQEVARAALMPQAPVQTSPACSHWLAVSVDIAPTPQDLHLTFKGAEPTAQAQLRMGAQPLRQWLGIVHDSYLKAGWPLDGWPDWMAAGSRPGGAPHSTSMH
jgi:hypothetical protein